MRLVPCLLLVALLASLASAARRPQGLKLTGKLDASSSCSCIVRVVKREMYGGFPANSPFIRASFGFYNSSEPSACGYVYFTENGSTSGHSAVPYEMAGCSEGQPVMFLPFNTTYQASLSLINSASFDSFIFRVDGGEGWFGEDTVN